ncbi:fibronectin type III domain-containing protein [Arthrobacter sp. 92]|uniref:fibronectin type III domain-containing protein n=1 Tax=Arthrobacter sp. 92 TaxID=3418175 RepID=UPI003CFD70E0
MVLQGTVFPAPAVAAASTIVSLTFDDANADQVAAASTMNSKGLLGTFFTPSGYMNAPGYMTTAQVQALQSAGNEIGGHTVTHPDLTAMSTDEATRQVCNDRVNLTNWGLVITDFAYPFAASNASVETVVKNCGLNSARGLGDIQSKGGCTGCGFAESIPPADPYLTKAPDEVDNTWTLSDLQSLVTNAQNSGGGWVQVTFHHIGTGTTDPLTITSALFDQYTTWLKSQQDAGSIAVKTVRGVIGGPVQPVIAGPPPPAPITSGNLLQNPSLETAGPVAGLPKCWATGSYGSNTPTFSEVSPGHTGTVAERLTMTNYVDGDAKLLPTLDLGECSPTGTVGHIYQLKAWYKSTAPTQFEVYVRTGIGTWQYWTASPLLNAASGWTQATWSTPALPSGANAVSFGLNLISNGTLTTDDYEMNDLSAATATAPAAPTGVTATAGNASATVAWTAPNNGGSAITSYTVTPHTGTTNLTPVTTTGNPPATSTTITGLTNGTAYTFTVTATNAIGTSPASSASNTVTPAATATAPAAPTGVTATAGNASATVAWTAPNNGGSAITSYTVTPHTGTTNLTPVTITGNPPATSTTITGLTNGTAYTFTVTATNAIGTSPASSASNTVTPAATTAGTSITNGGFESGLTGWSTGGVKAPVTSTTAHTGTGSALLGLASGTEPLGDSSLSQTITVPATGTSTLRFWYQPHTNDDTCTGTTCQYDWMEAQVRSTTGTTLGSIFKLCSNSGTWTQITADLTAYKGQTITLWFNVHLDGTSPADDTWMYLDDATLTNTQTTATAPAAPTGVTATAGNASATVAWTAPNNGGSAITSYTVTPHTGTTNLTPVTITGNPPATSTTITGLTNGTAYTFTVTATNAIGTSPASSASNTVTPAATTAGTSITNGGFESGLTGWSTGGVKAPVTSTTAHTGTGSALLGLASGAEPLGDSSLSQTITVPATGTSTLRFWYQPHTNDDTCTGTTCQYDWMEAQVRSTTGTTLGSIFKLCSNSGTWTQITADLTAYKGQTITLWFNVHLDGTSPADDTWMYLDDATLTNG